MENRQKKAYMAQDAARLTKGITMSKVVTLEIHLSDSEYEVLTEIAEQKDFTVESLMVDCLINKFGLINE